MLKSKFRVEVPGCNSIFVRSYEAALGQAAAVMARNGFGYIHAIGSGPSRLVARFAPYYGVTPA